MVFRAEGLLVAVDIFFPELGVSLFNICCYQITDDLKFQALVDELFRGWHSWVSKYICSSNCHISVDDIFDQAYQICLSLPGRRDIFAESTLFSGVKARCQTCKENGLLLSLVERKPSSKIRFCEMQLGLFFRSVELPDNSVKAAKYRDIFKLKVRIITVVCQLQTAGYSPHCRLAGAEDNLRYWEDVGHPLQWITKW